MKRAVWRPFEGLFTRLSFCILTDGIAGFNGPPVALVETFLPAFAHHFLRFHSHRGAFLPGIPRASIAIGWLSCRAFLALLFILYTAPAQCRHLSHGGNARFAPTLSCRLAVPVSPVPFCLESGIMDGLLPSLSSCSVVGRKTQRTAVAIAARCIGHRSALRSHMHRSAFLGV